MCNTLFLPFQKPFICEDSAQLLDFMRESNNDADIPDPPEELTFDDEDVRIPVRRFRRRKFQRN